MADIKKQLSNVAFGGSWSEEIVVNAGMNDALEQVARAVDECRERDVRTSDLFNALEYIKANVGKGRELAERLLKALDEPNPEIRHTEAKRAEISIIRWSGGE